MIEFAGTLKKLAKETFVSDWFHGVAVSTSPLHGLDTGSIPVGTM